MTGGVGVEMRCNAIVSHPALTSITLQLLLMAVSNGEKRSKEGNSPKTSHMHHVGVESICHGVGGFVVKCLKIEQETSLRHKECLCLQTHHHHRHHHHPPSTQGNWCCCCQALRENLGRYCVCLLHPRWSSSETSSFDETDDLTHA